MNKNITTKELLDFVCENSNKYVEASLILKGCSSMHILCLRGDNLFDEGIDGEIRKINCEIFLYNYPNAYWNIEQVI